MSLKTSNDYHSYVPMTYTSPSCSFYYSNPPQLFQLPISLQDFSVKSDDQTQLQSTINTHLPNKDHRQHFNTPTKQLHQSIHSTEPIPTSSDDYKINSIHRSDSRTSEKHQQFVKQQSLRQPSVSFQRANTIDDSQQSKVFYSINDYCHALRDQSATISNEALAHLLDKFTSILKSFDNDEQEQQELSVIIDILDALLYVPPSVIASASQHEFFSILQIPLIHILRQWHRLSSLENNEFLTFQTATKLIQRFIKATDDIELIPSWFSDSTLLETVSNCITDIATSNKFLNENNKSEFKYFTRLIDAYIHYQQRLNDENHPDKDTLLPLLDPIRQCLTSSYFINSFVHPQKYDKSMTTIEKFFLIKCPAFFISYNGSHLEQTMKSLLSTMLPQYVQALGKLVPSVHNWKRSTIQAVQHLLEIINHGANQFPTNAKLVSYHLLLIDHVLKLVNEPLFYNNLHETLSNPETSLMNTAISFLVNMISEPSILAHIKQCQVAKVFLRLTSCRYEPLVFNVYTLLAYTTHEDDIKAMPSPGRLLATIIQSLKTTLAQKPERKTQIEQLLEILKGLVQHDQIKDEIIKQTTLPFLLECANKLMGKAYILIFEILWSLTFRAESALALRFNTRFLDKIKKISKDTDNEPLKKAADGLVWKLIQEPASLQKVAKQEEEQEAAKDEITKTTQIVIGENGEEQVVTTRKRGSMTPSDRSFQYDMMISYCHTDKELTYKIHKFLVDQGFKVWIDLDHMYGPAMSAMAEAVENSEFVIMCMSDSYKQSTYCQAEAEYAFKCKRRLLPLVMRQGYKPDGWLGLMIGSRMYIDFGRFDFDTACEKLVTEISLQRKQTLPTILINPLDHRKPTKTPPNLPQPVEKAKKSSSNRHREKPPVNKNLVSSVFKARQSKIDFYRKPITQWTESDVLDFLLAHRLNQLIPLCESMNGRALKQLYKICTSHRLRAYSVLKDELKSKGQSTLSLGIYSQFLSITEEAINSLSKPAQSIDNQAEILSTIPFIPAPNLDMSYDFLITSNASPYDTLKMVESFGSQLQLLDSLRRRISNVS